MVNMEKKMGKILAILNDLGFEGGVGWDWLYHWVYSIVTGKQIGRAHV